MEQQSRSGVFRTCSRRVLIVDHDSDAAELYAIWLRRDGYRVSIATDADHALVLAPLLKPEAAVIDVGTPAVDGLELLHELRELPSLRPCHYIAIIAAADTRLHDRCLAAGFGSVLEKPLFRSMLLGSILAAPLLAPSAHLGW